MMRHTVNFFADEIDGNKLSQKQCSRIKNVFDALKDERNVLNFQHIIDLLGHYAPEAVLKRLFSSHKQTTSYVTLDIFLRLLRFLLNGTEQDKIRALCCYYTCGQPCVSMDALKVIIEQEEWSMDKLGSLSKREGLFYDELNECFSQSEETTNVSKWLLGSRLTLASSALNLPSKLSIMSTSTGIDEGTLCAEYVEFKRIAVCDDYLINQSSFRDSLTDIFPDPFITGLFKFFDVNNDGYIDVMEFCNGLAFLPHAKRADSTRRIFQMFSSQTQAGVIFNSIDFDNTLQHFVPPRVLREPSCRISYIAKCRSLSDFTSWATNNPAFLHFIEFLKALMHIVFGLPLPPSESETSKVIMLWLHYMIVQPFKQGSQWFIVSSQHWPSLVKQGSILGLKLSHHYEKHDSYHPISLYKELFTAASIPTRRVPLRRISPQNRTRSLSYAGGLNTRMLEKPVHHQRSLQRLFKRRSLHREMKAEKEAGRGMTQHSHQRRYSKSINHSVNLPSGGEVAPYSGGTKSREEMWMIPEEPVLLEEITQSPFIAVDRRLAERLQCWSGLNSNSISINGNGQLMPSYLILNTPVCDDSKDEVMELYALEIGVHWIAGCKPKVLPTEGVITDTGVPKNPQLFVPPFSLAYGGANEMPTTSGKKWPARKRFASTIEEPGVNPTWRERKRSGVLNSNTYTRSISVPGKNWSTFNLDCIYVLPEKLSGQSLRFAFSRCHTILEVCEVVGKAFSDYRNHDLTPDTYRVWFVKTAESADASRQKPKLNPITKPASNSSDTNTSDDEKDNGNNLLAKRICLAPVDFKAIGDQQLGRFLADQDPSVLHNGELFDIYGKCSKKFEFVIECLQQANSWPLGQRPSEAGPFVGLKNMGNTCYFNSVIQCLRVTPLLEDRIRSCATSQTKLANEYLKLLDQMMQEGSANPRILWHAFVQKVPTFRSSVQQDAHEFLIIFLDLLNEELKQKHAAPKDGTLKPHDSRRKSTITNNSCAAAQTWSAFCAENDSPITTIFYGLCESRCQFEGCSHKTSSFDFFASLTLPLPVDEVNSIILTVVPSYVAVPEKCRLESDHSITLDFLRQQVSRRYKCLPSQVFLGQYCNEILTPLPYSSTESGKVNSKFNYWAFILPSRCSGSSSDREVLAIVQNRILVPLQSPLLEETADQRELHGSPIVLHLSSTTTNKGLYDAVQKSISRYHKSSDTDRSYYKTSNKMGSTAKISELSDGQYFFVLKQAEKHFWRCSKCRWPKMCRGCPIPCTSEKVDLRPSGNGCIYIAADWSLDEFINEYQPTQAVGVKVADKIGSSDSDAANAIRLSSLLQKFFEEELVSRTDGIFCNHCQGRKSFTMSTMLCELPEVLLISLKRFHATNRGWRKSSNLVHFPLTSLDMKTYLSKEAKCENTIYDLYGVVNHMGRLDAGHYYAFIRVEDGRWFRVNDMQYSEVREESVVTPDAYILFYRRRHSAQHFQAH